MSDKVAEITENLMMLGDQAIAEHSQRFFKTGKGQYGEGDRFLGIRVPVLRKMATKYKNISLDETIQLLQSDYHEIRLLAVILMGNSYEKADASEQKTIYELYLNNTDRVNNWDIVDASSHKIVGPYLFDKDKTVLYELAGSEDLWERRIAVMATFYFIRQHHFRDVLRISAMLLKDDEDLIHKAVGWMLREVGKRSKSELENFLQLNYRNMPRTMLRYAIEKLPEKERQSYLKGNK